MGKDKLFIYWQEISKLSGLVGNFVQNHCLHPTGELSVGTFSAHNLNVSKFVLSAHFKRLGFKTNYSRVIFIKNRHSTAGVIAFQALISSLMTNFNEKVFIGLPNLIVNNFDSDFSFHFTFFHLNYLVE
jgi:hypothetical protein